MISDSENQFLIWLHSVNVKYLGLSASQKLRTIDTIIGLLGSKVIYVVAMAARV